MVPLSSLVTIRRIAGPEYTNRFNLYRAAQVIGSAAPGYSSGQAIAALEEVAQQVLPPEMGYDWSDLSYQERKFSGSALPVFGLSLVFVFLILAALYESWSLPFSRPALGAVAVFGAFVGLLLRKYDLDVYAQIGLIMLIGLSAKNAILIVEFAKIEFEKGRDLVEAALVGARLRLRPILMTSFAFILGCVPLWIAKGAGRVRTADPRHGRDRRHARGHGARDLPHSVPLRHGREDRDCGGRRAPARRRGRPDAGTVGGSDGMRRLVAALLALVARSFSSAGAFSARTTSGPAIRRSGGRTGARSRPREPAASLADQPWWEVFGDDALKALDRRGAAEQLRRAHRRRARRGVPRARRNRPRRPLCPQIGYQGQVAHGRQSDLVSGEDERARREPSSRSTWACPGRSTSAAGSGGCPRRRSRSTSRRRRRGAACMLSVVSQVAQSYFQLRELDERLEIARRTTEAFQGTLRPLQPAALGRRGVGPRGRARGGGARDRRGGDPGSREADRGAGEPPVVSARPQPGPDSRGERADRAADPGARCPAGLPDALLERRPDVRQAEAAARRGQRERRSGDRELLSHDQPDGGVRRREPRGLDSFRREQDLVDRGERRGPDLPGRPAAQPATAANRAVFEELAAASTNPPSATRSARSRRRSSRTRSSREVEERQARTVAAYREAVRLANIRYLAGLSSYVEVLDAQQQLFPAEIALAQTRSARLTNLVTLYRALGGGWNRPRPAVRPRAPTSPTSRFAAVCARRPAPQTIPSLRPAAPCRTRPSFPGGSVGATLALGRRCTDTRSDLPDVRPPCRLGPAVRWDLDVRRRDRRRLSRCGRLRVAGLEDLRPRRASEASGRRPVVHRTERLVERVAVHDPLRPVGTRRSTREDPGLQRPRGAWTQRSPSPGA